MVYNNLCCCCLSEACCKDIYNEYVHSGSKEKYSEMLWDTFNLNISTQYTNSQLICEECIKRLRDSAAFKKKIQYIKDNCFKSVINNVASDDKVKLLNQDDFLDYITGEFDDGDDLADGDEDIDHFTGDDSVWHGESLGNTNEIKLEREDDMPLLMLQKCTYKKTKNSSIKKEKRGIVKRKTEQQKINEAVRNEKRLKRLPQIERKQNSLKLINNSNICLFKSMKTKYRCFYCENSFLNITELREHTQTHPTEGNSKVYNKRLQGMSYKCADISDLSCKICSQKTDDLVDLKSHLTEEHDVQFSGTETMLIPYRLEDGFDCVVCKENFNNFYKLSVHMNSHYTNHMCEICGASYINRLSLRMHVNSRHKENKCSICSAKFLNAYQRVKHMRKVHNSSESKRYCLLCDKTFKYTYMLVEHKIQEHGMKRTISVCPECGKSFLSAVNLRTHIRCVHIKERKHSCSECGMCFFTSCDRRRHERTHQDIRLFACSYCDGRFKSKDSLRRHLKRQHGHMYTADGQHAT